MCRCHTSSLVLSDLQQGRQLLKEGGEQCTGEGAREKNPGAVHMGEEGAVYMSSAHGEGAVHRGRE